MTSPAVDQSLHYARKNWPILSALVAGAILWGMLFNKVEALEEKSKVRDAERDRLIQIETKVETMTNRLAELKEEQRANTDRLRGLENSVNNNFRELMEELREASEDRRNNRG